MVLADAIRGRGDGSGRHGPWSRPTALIAEDELPSYRAVVRAARSGQVAVEGREELLDTFLRAFTRP
ncbi:hypothetical protein AB0A63_11635 [Lentzea sp. NPDC042327]|uniref:hypothetical protein n=1 Tax=Lentzea sp. NPDC042327 TaxID=3154801 RepID=UPI0033EE6B33